MIEIIRSNTTYGQLDHVKNRLRSIEGLDFSHILLCEDRFTLSLEQIILEEKESKGSFSVNVFSFSRLLYQLLKNQKKRSYLTKTGAVMAVSKILLENHKNLKCYGSLSKNYSSLSESIYAALSQMKSSEVTFSDLALAKDIKQALKLKLEDLSFVFEKYEDFKKHTLLDANDKLELLIELIQSSDFIKDSSIHIVGFASFTKQIYSAISALAGSAKYLTIYLLEDKNEVYDKNNTYRFTSIFDALGLKYTVKRADEKLNEDKTFISNYLFSYLPPLRIPKKKTESIRVFEATSASEELDFISQNIINEVRVKGKRFSDICVLGSSLEESEKLIKSVFSSYEIPYFIDKKTKLSDNIFAKCLISSLNLSGDDFELSDVFTLLYSPFFALDYGEKCDFENYLIYRGVKNTTFKKDRPFSDERMREIRNALFERFDISPKSLAPLKEYVLLTRKLIMSLSPELEKIAENFLIERETSSSYITLQMQDKIEEVLIELDNILGDSLILFSDYIKILSDGLSSKEVSTLPLYSDCVFVGDFSMSKFEPKKVLFAFGVNHKQVPLQKTDLGLISDKDIDEMEGAGVILEPKIETVNERERLNVFLALLSYAEKLFISYSLTNAKNEANSKSEVVTTFLNMFESEDGDILIPHSEDFPSLDSPLSSYMEEAIPTKKIALKKFASALSSSLFHSEKFQTFLQTLKLALEKSDLGKEAEQLYSYTPWGKLIAAFDTKTEYSVSSLETYFSCPFVNYMKYALRAKERPVGNVMAFDSGNYIHGCLEIFMKNISKTNALNFDNEAKKVTALVRMAEPYSLFDGIPRLARALDRLDNEFYFVAKELFSRKNTSKFEPLGEEIKFGKGKPLAPLYLTDDVTLQGAIDYADTFEKSVRVIDYKTGVISAGADKIYFGLKFQPYVYLAALQENLDLKPAGALYLPIHDKFAKNEDEAKYRMDGFITSDKTLLDAMDSELEKNSTSEVIPVSLTKKGEVHSASHCLDEEQFSAFIKYSKKLAKKAIDEIRGGNIIPSPFKGSCEYCSFKSVCNYDASYFGERDKDGKITKQIIMEAAEND